MSTDTTKTDHRQRDVYAVLFALVLPTFVTLAYFVWSDGMHAGLRQGIYAVAKVVQFLLPIVWVVFVQRQRPRFGFKSRNGLVLGIGFGVAVLVAALGLYHGWLSKSEVFVDGTAAIREKIASLGVGSVWRFAAMGVFYSLVHSLLEEYYWRWFVFDQLKRLISVGGAIAVSSLGFMAHHVLVVGEFFGYGSPLTWLLSAAVAIGGWFWAWLYHRSGSLIGPWLGHLLVDAAIFVIGYEIAKPLFGGS
ncbi:MAG: type II CAAX endopeptidase family protein [Planctomycetota bacterium]